ncbi:conserved hypothetical protein [Microsporum canis CBS 113480]|uniref:Uncharacterized protein n=1 Tax=Arthroderma otae (strain ATCC MYA-4605 / CBS 113480) TaxID=554155 RepID=C5FJV0_ARTOC|nr:conserved hypothetical protein [Microsporum canis CBS 113480]EEQ30961.1 conserved hypothetical protein [Microsporum canis CBS 113480]
MVQFTSAIMAPATAAFLLSFLATSVYATPVGTGMAGSSVDVGTFSNVLAEKQSPEFTECMKKEYPLFPDVDFIDPHVTKNCLGATHSKGQGTGDLVARGKSFDFKSTCIKLQRKDFPSVFQEAAPFRAKTDGFCDKMRGAVIDKGEGENYEVLGDTTFKYSDAGYARPKLKYNNPDALALKTTLKLTDRGKDLIKDAENPEVAYNELCRPAFEKFGTKGPGCTEELNCSRLRSQGGGGFTTTLVKNGDMKILDGEEEIGTLIVDLQVLNKWPGLTKEEENGA